jgi:hypothetical protein
MACSNNIKVLKDAGETVCKTLTMLPNPATYKIKTVRSSSPNKEKKEKESYVPSIRFNWDTKMVGW